MTSKNGSAESRRIRAIYTEETVRVYQAYSPRIAMPALRAGRFVAPFKMGRMTWIKPSFNWMMYRCGFGTKVDQEVVLGIDLRREGFEWALGHAALSSHDGELHGSAEEWREELSRSLVRVQWDPERDWRIGLVEGVRSVQIGISGEAVVRYVEEWIVGIEDVTPMARATMAAMQSRERPAGHPDEREREYAVGAETRARLGME